MFRFVSSAIDGLTSNIAPSSTIWRLNLYIDATAVEEDVGCAKDSMGSGVEVEKVGGQCENGANHFGYFRSCPGFNCTDMACIIVVHLHSGTGIS